MKSTLLIALVFLNMQIAFSQVCDCATNFEFVVSKMKANYIGYNDKIQKYHPKGFALYTSSLHKQSKLIRKDFQCLQLMNNWLSKFRDGHVGIRLEPDSLSEAEIQLFFSMTEKTTIAKKYLTHYISSNLPASDSLTGIWEDEYKNYKVAVIEDPGKKNSFIGFILETKSPYWQKGQVKFRLKRKNKTFMMDYYYSMEHTKHYPSFSSNRQSLNFGDYGTWKKAGTPPKNATSISNIDTIAPSFQVIDKQNCIFKIPKSNPVYIRTMDSLISANYAILRSTEHLIIDLRSNSGGTTLLLEKLIPFLYTNPIVAVGASVLASVDNIKFYSFTDYQGVSDSMKIVFEKEANLLKAHTGEIYKLWPDDTLILKEVFGNPIKISILVNGDCASSTELFLLRAAQSKKVTLFGRRTMGAVDYTDGVSLSMPCKFLKLSYSSSRTNRWPQQQIDNIGIQPDVKIPNAITDWTQFTMDYYKNTKKY